MEAQGDIADARGCVPHHHHHNGTARGNERLPVFVVAGGPGRSVAPHIGVLPQKERGWRTGNGNVEQVGGAPPDIPCRHGVRPVVHSGLTEVPVDALVEVVRQVLRIGVQPGHIARIGASGNAVLVEPHPVVPRGQRVGRIPVRIEYIALNSRRRVRRRGSQERHDCQSQAQVVSRSHHQTSSPQLVGRCPARLASPTGRACRRRVVPVGASTRVRARNRRRQGRFMSSFHNRAAMRQPGRPAFPCIPV